MNTKLTPKKPGRPFSEVPRRDKIGTTKFSATEWELVREKAVSLDMTISAYLRRRALKGLK